MHVYSSCLSLCKKIKGETKKYCIMHLLYPHDNKETLLNPQRQFKQRFKFCSAFRSDWRGSELSCENVCCIFFLLLPLCYQQPAACVSSASAVDVVAINTCCQTYQTKRSHFLCQTQHYSLDSGLRGSSDAFVIEGALRGWTFDVCAHFHMCSRLRVCPLARLFSPQISQQSPKEVPLLW